MPYSPYKGVSYAKYNTPPSAGDAVWVELEPGPVQLTFDHRQGLGPDLLYPYGFTEMFSSAGALASRVPPWNGSQDPIVSGVIIPANGRYELMFQSGFLHPRNPYGGNPGYSWDAGDIYGYIKRNGVTVLTTTANFNASYEFGPTTELVFPGTWNLDGQRFPDESVILDLTAGDEITVHMDVPDLNILNLTTLQRSELYWIGGYIGVLWVVTNPDDTGELCVPRAHFNATKTIGGMVGHPDATPYLIGYSNGLQGWTTAPWALGCPEESTSYLEGEQTLDLLQFPYAVNTDPLRWSWNTETCNPPADPENPDWFVSTTMDFIGHGNTFPASEEIPIAGAPWGTVKVGLVDGVYVEDFEIFFTTLRAEVSVPVFVSSGVQSVVPGEYGTPVTLEYTGPLSGVAMIVFGASEIFGRYNHMLYMGGYEGFCADNFNAELIVTGPAYECCDGPPPPPPPPPDSTVLQRRSQVNLMA